MQDFKYKLEKYNGRSTRFMCPSCKQAHEFTRYQDQETKEYVHPSVGICNRRDRCGYHYTPSQYFRDHGTSYVSTIEVTPTPPRPIDYIPEEVMTASLNTENNFIKYLRSLFETKSIINAIEKYHIGDTTDGKVIYWQVDREGKIRTGKAMQYDPSTSKRVKDNKAVSWMHNQVKRDFNLKQCLYGLHLYDKNKTTAIVESEKTAIIASLAMPQFTWMATGGLQNTKLIDELKGCKVILFPDLGEGFEAWTEYALQNGFKVSSFLQDRANDEDKANGLDLADYVICSL